MSLLKKQNGPFRQLAEELKIIPYSSNAQPENTWRSVKLNDRLAENESRNRKTVFGGVSDVTGFNIPVKREGLKYCKNSADRSFKIKYS